MNLRHWRYWKKGRGSGEKRSWLEIRVGSCFFFEGWSWFSDLKQRFAVIISFPYRDNWTIGNIPDCLREREWESKRDRRVGSLGDGGHFVVLFLVRVASLDIDVHPYRGKLTILSFTLILIPVLLLSIFNLYLFALFRIAIIFSIFRDQSSRNSG